MEPIKIGVLVGSSRKGSFNQLAAEQLIAFMPESVTAEKIAINHLPMFHQDYDDDGETPLEWIDFREQIQQMDAFLFVTPEYNRSFPPVIKNAIDIASRPAGQNLWSAKPGAVVSVAAGKTGGFGANHHLRQVLSFLNIYMMQQPEVYLGQAEGVFDESGQILNPATKVFLQKVIHSFIEWIGKFN